MGVPVPWLPEQDSSPPQPNPHLLVDSFYQIQQIKMPGKGSKKAKKSGSNIFSLFSQKQIQEFKEAFGIIDVDKDGIITANDLKAAFVNIGRPITDAEANNLVVRLLDPSTSPRWSRSLQRKWLEVLMT